MTHAATRVITVTAMNVLATAAMHLPSDPPSAPPPPIHTRPFVLAASPVLEPVPAAPNRLIAARSEAAHATDLSVGAVFASRIISTPTGTTRTTRDVNASPNPLVAVHPHASAVHIGSDRQAAAVTALPTPQDVGDQLRAFVAVYISNGTAAHPDAGFLIGNGF